MPPLGKNFINTTNTLNIHSLPLPHKLDTFQPSTFNSLPSFKMLSKSIISAILAWPALVAAAPHNVEERATPELTITQKLRLADT